MSSSAFSRVRCGSRRKMFTMPPSARAPASSYAFVSRCARSRASCLLCRASSAVGQQPVSQERNEVLRRVIELLADFANAGEVLRELQGSLPLGRSERLAQWYLHQELLLRTLWRTRERPEHFQTLREMADGF